MIKVVEQPVSIKTLYVGKSKFTKSLFSQLLIQSPFDINLNFVRGEAFGFVHTNGARYLIWVNEGKLRKYDLEYLYDIYGINKYTELDEVEDALHSFRFLPQNNQYASPRGIETWGLTDEERERLDAIMMKAKETVIFLSDKQIFL